MTMNQDDYHAESVAFGFKNMKDYARFRLRIKNLIRAEGFDIPDPNESTYSLIQFLVMEVLSCRKI